MIDLESKHEPARFGEQAPLFGSWLAQTLELQVTAYGQHPEDQSVADWLEYVRNQTLAAFVELGEFIQNLTWKPWARIKAMPNVRERDESVEELVDVLHFIANNLSALGVSDDELNAVYGAKMQKNRARMAQGGH